VPISHRASRRHSPRRTVLLRSRPDTIYSAIDAKSKSTLKLQRLENLRRHPAVAVLIDHYDDDWAELWWVRADGRGRVVDHGEEHERAKSLLGASTPSTDTSPSRVP